MLPHRSARLKKVGVIAFSAALGALAACSRGVSVGSPTVSGSAGPADQGPPLPTRQDGNATAGRDVFRFETFGNEGFWTDAVRVPQGMTAARVTPMQMLALGVQVDIDALDAGTRSALATELRADPSGRGSSILNDPATTAKLVNANAVIGMPIKDSNGDGVMDVTRGDKVGTSCAFCHTMTDGSTLNMPSGGSIGHRIDGLANHNLAVGKVFAVAGNTRALYPILQLSLRANGGKTLGRAPTGLTENSTEAEVDAYLSNPAYYPVGMFDDSFDGNGDPMHNTPMFRGDLSAPYGSEGMIARLDNFSNLVYTSLFDLTMLTTPGGRALLHKLGGAAGDEIADNYVKVLAATNVRGYPFITGAAPHPMPGSEDAPLGVRVSEQKLRDMNAYFVSLEAPRAPRTDEAMVSRGRAVFASANCASCHNTDQGRSVPTTIHPMSQIFPGDNPVTLGQRTPPLNPVLNTVSSIFDDKMAVVNASLRGEKRGIAMPLLLDLARKPVFLHDNTVPSLDALLDPSRGASMPHPFYVQDTRDRAAVVEYLRSLETIRRR